MSLFSVSLVGLLAVLVFMTVIWLVSLRVRNASIVDIFWGPGFALAAGVYYLLTPDGFSARKLLVLALVTIWALRLGLHIGVRNHGKPEDYRYAAWRREAGEAWWWRSFFKVFLLQGAILWVIAWPLLVAQFHAQPATLTVFDGLGIALWGVGFFFEAVGDYQLIRFKADPANRGKVMRSGLWRYTRHPNYFGDATLWWGLFCLAVSVPGGVLTAFSPLLMTTLLMRVSGVALLERGLSKTKPEYADYIASTNAFFPGWPRK